MTDESQSAPCSTTVILVRHGDVHNPGKVVYGRLPRFGLSAIGREEAATSAAVLADLDLAAIYTSPLLRARQTAVAIAAHHPGVPIHVSSLIAEVRTAWQGTTYEEMVKNKINYYEHPKDPSDETVDQVTARMLRWFGMVLRRHRCGIVIGVSHGDPSMMPRLFYSSITPSPEALRDEKMYPQKASITRFVFHESGDPWQLRPEVFYDDPNRSAREEREAIEKAAKGEASGDAAVAPATAPAAEE